MIHTAIGTGDLLEENVGKLVTLIQGKGYKPRVGILLEDAVRHDDGLHGKKVISRYGNDYLTIYFGSEHCAVISQQGRGMPVLTITENIGCDGSYGPKPGYDCPLKEGIDRLEEALNGVKSA